MRKKPISMRLDKEILKRLKKTARSKKTSFTQLVTDILWKYLENESKK